MSNLAFGHLMGTTSLERKCRFWFGLVILAVVSASLLWYGQKTESLVRKQTTQTARMLVRPALMNLHSRSLGNTNFEPILDALLDDLKPLDDLPNYNAWFLGPDRATEAKKQPRDDFERATLARFIKSAAVSKPGHSPEKLHVFADGTPTWAEQPTADRKEYHYIQAVFFKPNCLMDCHGKDDTPIDRNHGSRLAPDGQHRVKTEPGDLAGAVVVSLPMEQTTKAINSNRATLITFALVSSVLAMVGSYLAIHYVIVRPAGDPHDHSPLGG